MVTYHKYTALAIGLLSLIVLQAFSVPEPVFRFLFVSFFLYCVAVFFYNRWYLRHIRKYNLWAAIRSVLLPASAFGVFLFIPSSGLRGLFLIATVVVITVFEYYLENFSENALLIQTLLTAFGFFYAFFGMAWDFPPYAFAATVGLFFATALSARAFYESIPQPDAIKTIMALLLSLFCSELFWAMTFLPFHFSALAFFLFNIFYVCLIFNYYHVFHTLTFKKIQFHLLFMLVCDLLVIIFTPWAVLAKGI